MKWLRLPPLAVGIGIYLPMSATLAGGDRRGDRPLVRRWTKRTRNPEYAKRLAVLIASGMIVGESLWGVINAGLISATEQGCAAWRWCRPISRGATGSAIGAVRAADRGALWLDHAPRQGAPARRR